jgi:hypothetical protein
MSRPHSDCNIEIALLIFKRFNDACITRLQGKLTK